ncbi:putative peptidoglycan glycosyltransferase FtsW [Methylocella tundrae]|uniref:Probable peptidoglycan glycosyltransferase FtsW n=1 Tax=Methylocella tundrae TaxID=227605 RepID=A0A8B6M1K1_METTU|nr:putative peptidoglycan glycosyltransferase FtsW [Methylocella tundrae]VTZ48625.1 putative peptidoglycan glycosyltransferase FtsW [Methylocella tundrae]
MASRAERSALANWWWTIDRWMLAAIAALIVLGLVLTMAGSPPVAERLGLPTFHFVHRQALAMIPTIAVLLLSSFLTPRQVRRAALIIFIVAMALIVAALLFGHEVKGSRRWIFGIQPSEFLKPAFVILAAWAFAEGGKRKDVPGNLIALMLLPLTIIPLILQPDFGQTLLISIVWSALFFMAGLHWFWVVGIGGAGFGGVLLAYKFVPHVRVRVLKFLDPAAGGGIVDTFQVDTALDSFLSGGWFGKGPGEGTVKRILPDAHTDFIFAVTGEEFGIAACLFIVALFAFIVLRGLVMADRNEDPFCRLAAAGLVMMFGIQSAINMAVNLHLMPAKGMTLPFISYGGSSLVSLALGIGFLIAVTRKRPGSRMFASAGAQDERYA